MVFANKCKASPLPFRYFSEIQKARADDLHELRLTLREKARRLQPTQPSGASG